MANNDPKAEMEALQIALVRTQQAVIEEGQRVVVVLEGRDAAGKDGAIKRITENLPPRHTRVVALPKPTEAERSQWYFQRYVAHLPTAGELVIFNRSWYNRAGVEPVMGFCTPAEHAQFLRDAPEFEHMLTQSGVRLLKYWLDISKAEQARRLEKRRTDPLKILKVSPLDAAAQERWDAYSEARNEMLVRTDTPHAPWTCVRNDDKGLGRLNLIRSFLRQTAPTRIAEEIDRPDPDILFRFEPEALKDGRLAH